MKRTRSFLLVFLLLSCVFVLLHKTIGFYYFVNDDTSMRSIAMGYRGGSPDGHLIYIRYLYGCLVAFLFRLFPGFDWYGLLFLGLSFLCYGLVICRIFAMTETCLHKLGIRIFCLLILFVAFYDSVIFFQFTTVAGTIAVTAAFLLLTYDREQGPGKYILIWMLYLIAALIRTNVFLMTLPFFGIAALYQLLRRLNIAERPSLKNIQKLCWKPLMPFFLITVVGICLYGGIIITERYAYSDEAWKDYKEFKHHRSMLYDYYGWPSYEGNEEFWEELGVSREERACMGMFGILPDVDTEKIGQIAGYSQEIYEEMGIRERANQMWSVFAAFIKSSACRAPNILLLISIICFIFLYIKSGWRERFILLFFALAQMAVLFYLLYEGRMPGRIVVIYDFQWILGMLGFLLVQIKEKRLSVQGIYMKIITAALVLTMVPLTAFVIQDSAGDAADYNTALGTYRSYVEYLCREPENIYVVCTGTVASRKKFTWHDAQEHYNVIGTMGWICKSPHVENYMERLGLDPESDILLTDHVFLVTADLSQADLLNAFYQSEAKVTSGYEVVDTVSLPDGRLVYFVRWL